MFGSGSLIAMLSAHCSTAPIKSTENWRVRIRAFRSRVDSGRSGLLSDTKEHPDGHTSRVSAATSNRGTVSVHAPNAWRRVLSGWQTVRNIPTILGDGR